PSVIQVGDAYFLYPVGGSSGPQLSVGGAPVIAGQDGPWAPIGAEQTANGYEVAWKAAGLDQYLVWATNSSGAYTSTMVSPVSGSSSALQALEPSSHQALTAQGTTALPP